MVKTQNTPISASVKQPGATPADSGLQKESESQFPLGKRNFRLMAIAVAVIILGFLLMLGGSSTEEAFNPDIFSVRRVVIGPTIAFLGFLGMIYAIIRYPESKK
jgi:hypothetical protein